MLNLGFLPGATSSPIDVKKGFEAKWKGLNFKEVTLHPGDVLFIPRFWAHATSSVSYNEASTALERTAGKESIAVNMFFRDLHEASYAKGRDVYGSRDLEAYELAREMIQKLAKRLNNEKHGERAQQLAVQLQNKVEAEIGLPGQKIGYDEIRFIRLKFAHLPTDVGRFYLPRLAKELLSMVETLQE